MDLQAIARSGGSIRVSAEKKSTMDLQAIARCLCPDGKVLIMIAERKSKMELQAISRSAPGTLLFDLT